MYTTSNIIRNAKKASVNSILIFDDDSKMVKDKETGEDICSYEKYADSFRKEIGCDFSNVCYFHAMLQHVVRCNRCGTVIFSSEDEDYEPGLRCPNCTDYETRHIFWTKEEIDASEDKQKTIKSYENMQKEMDLDYEFEKKRGKPNNRICRFKVLNTFVEICCHNCRKSYFSGLTIHLWKINYDENGEIYNSILVKSIPLTPKGIYYNYVYRRNNKCASKKKI